jgi:hypothetical protein
MRPRHGFAYVGLYACAAISVALALGLAALQSHSLWLAWARLVFAVILLAEGASLAANWRDARELVLRRIQHGRRGLGGSRAATGLVSVALQLAGVIWIALAVFVGLTALQRLA